MNVYDLFELIDDNIEIILNFGISPDLMGKLTYVANKIIKDGHYDGDVSKVIEQLTEELKTAHKFKYEYKYKPPGGESMSISMTWLIEKMMKKNKSDIAARFLLANEILNGR